MGYIQFKCFILNFTRYFAVFPYFRESEVNAGRVLGDDGETFDLRERLVRKFWILKPFYYEWIIHHSILLFILLELNV